jgi:hypothetical protein
MKNWIIIEDDTGDDILIFLPISHIRKAYVTDGDKITIHFEHEYLEIEMRGDEGAEDFLMKLLEEGGRVTQGENGVSKSRWAMVGSGDSKKSK